MADFNSNAISLIVSHTGNFKNVHQLLCTISTVREVTINSEQTFELSSNDSQDSVESTVFSIQYNCSKDQLLNQITEITSIEEVSEITE